MTDLETLRAAWIAWEVERWQGEALRTTLAAEVDALYAWLQDVPLAQGMPPADAIRFVQRAVVDAPLPDALVAAVEECVKVAFAALRDDTTPLGELLQRRQYDQITETLVGLKDLRREITRQVVESPVYALLVSNVLYHGIKAFVLTENVFARKIPGASSLVRLGQSAMNSAVPGLEKGIDRQLTAFIRANIRETLAESERYLNRVLDDAMIWQLADDLWHANDTRTPADFMPLVNVASLVDGVDFVRAAWLHLCTTPLLQRMLTLLVEDFFARHGEKPVAALLIEMGFSPERVVDELACLAAPLAASAAESGYLEARARAHIDAFLTHYSA